MVDLMIFIIIYIVLIMAGGFVVIDGAWSWSLVEIDERAAR